ERDLEHPRLLVDLLEHVVWESLPTVVLFLQSSGHRFMPPAPPSSTRRWRARSCRDREPGVPWVRSTPPPRAGRRARARLPDRTTRAPPPPAPRIWRGNPPNARPPRCPHG